MFVVALLATALFCATAADAASTGRGCFYNGVMYKNGVEFKDEDQCQNCRCNNGLTECTPCDTEPPKASEHSN